MPRKKKEESLLKRKAPKAAAKPPRPAKTAPSPAQGARKGAPKARKTALPKAPKPMHPQERTAHERRSVKKISRPRSAWKPPKYGETQVVAFIRDPNCIFVYWEVASQHLEQVKAQLKGEYAQSRVILRMFRSRGDGVPDLIYEIEVDAEAMNQYLPIREPGFSYYVEVARKGPSGKTVVIARSNPLTPPVAGFSPQLEPAWAPVPELEQYLSETLEVGPENLPAPGALGGISSAEAQRRAARFRRNFSSFLNSN